MSRNRPLTTGVLARVSSWVRVVNRRRLEQRRLAQHRAAESAWFAHTDPRRPAVAAALRKRLAALPTRPLLSVVVRPGPHAARSVPLPESSYPDWELLIGAATPPNSIDPSDSRVRVVGDRADALARETFDRALRAARGEHVVLVPDDGSIAPHALLLVAEALARFPEARLIYADEDCIDASGRRHSPLLRCDWNAELMRASNYVDGLVVARRDALLQAGGLAAGPPAAAWWDLLLRLVERAPRGAIVHIPHVLWHRHESVAPPRDAAPPSAGAAERSVVQAHLDRCALAATALASDEGGVHVSYAVPREPPLVSLIIPTRNGLRLLRQCVQSIFDKTSYRPYEIVIVDNGSDEPDTLRYLQQLTGDNRVRVHRDDRPFNFAALNNAAVPLCRGSVLGLVNNDIEAVAPHWLGEMVGLAMCADVGAVGARLWYSDDTLQHAGVVLGMGGVAGHLHRRLPRARGGYQGRAHLTQEFSAVTAACLLMRRTVFEQVGGFDETHLAIDFNDIDLCLRIGRAGYRVVWTPHAELYHHESATRGAHVSLAQHARHASEFACMRQRWGDLLDNDPAYNPNASLKNNDFEFAIAERPRVSLLAPWFSRDTLDAPASAGAG